MIFYTYGVHQPDRKNNRYFIVNRHTAFTWLPGPWLLLQPLLRVKIKGFLNIFRFYVRESKSISIFIIFSLWEYIQVIYDTLLVIL